MLSPLADGLLVWLLRGVDPELRELRSECAKSIVTYVVLSVIQRGGEERSGGDNGADG